MKVILYKEVDTLGEVDTLVSVSDGYARNYLFPKKIAGPATPSALVALEKRVAARDKQMAARRGELEELAKKLSASEITIAVDAGEGGKLFGSVTAQDIAEAVKNELQIETNKKKIEIKDPIKAVGDYTVTVKIWQDINAELKVKVVNK